MPQRIQLPSGEIAEFPDEATDDQIVQALTDDALEQQRDALNAERTSTAEQLPGVLYGGRNIGSELAGGVERGVLGLGELGYRGAQAGLEAGRFLLPESAKDARASLASASEGAGSLAQEARRLSKETPGAGEPSLAGQIAETAVGSLGPLALAPAGLGAVALGAGFQQGASRYGEELEGGTDKRAALRRAALSGAITAAATAAGGSRGVEAVLRRSTGWRGVKEALREIPKEALSEVTEEAVYDQAMQIIADELTGSNTSRTPAQIRDELLTTAGLSAILGGGFGSLPAVAAAIEARRGGPQTVTGEPSSPTSPPQQPVQAPPAATPTPQQPVQNQPTPVLPAINPESGLRTAPGTEAAPSPVDLQLGQGPSVTGEPTAVSPTPVDVAIRRHVEEANALVEAIKAAPDQAGLARLRDDPRAQRILAEASPSVQELISENFGRRLAEVQAAPATRTDENQEQTTSPLPAEQGQPAEQKPAVEAQAGTPQRQGEGPAQPAEVTPAEPNTTSEPQPPGNIGSAPGNIGSASEPQTTTELQPDGLKVAAVELPVSQIEVDHKLVPQFKGDADTKTGEVRGQELKGKTYARPSNPVVVWELRNGRRVLVTGRHRLALARRLGEKTIPTTIVREADGFTREMAMTLDAEFNIRDGNGSVEDYETYFEGTNISAEEAAARGLLDRAKGKAAWDLARSASNDLKALWRAGKVREGTAVAIARAAPGNGDLQAVGIRAANQGKSADFAVNLMRAAEAAAGPKAATLDLFGADDSAIKAMEEQAKRATEEQRRIREQITAVQSAARRPEAAAKLGVNVSDPEGILRRIGELKAELARWDNWAVHPDLVAQVRGEPAPAPVAPPTAQAQSAPAAPSAQPFALEVATDEQIEAEKAAQAAKSDEKAAQEEAARKQAAPLTGTTGDLGQASLFGGPEDLFAGPTAEQQAGAPKPAVPPATESGPAVPAAEASPATRLKETILSQASGLEGHLEVVENGGEIPPRFYEGRDVDPNNIDGFYDPATDKIWINAARMVDPATGKVTMPKLFAKLVHEAAIHLGLRRVLGESKLAELAADIWKSLTKAERAAIAKRNGIDPADAAQIGEEWLAYEAERVISAGRSNSIWKKIAAVIRKALRKLGVTGRLTDIEIAKLVEQGWKAAAQEAAQSGEAAGTGTRFSIARGQVEDGSVLSKDYGASKVIQDPTAEQRLKEPYPEASAGAAKSKPSSRPAARSKRAKNRAGVRAVSSGPPPGSLIAALKDPLNPAKWRNAFRSSDVVSAIDPEKVPAGTATFNVIGQRVSSPEDFARLLIPLRSPYQESLKVAILNDAGEVVHSEVLYTGIIAGVNLRGADFIRLMERYGKQGRRLIMAHNHPSGDPRPSGADIMATGRLNRIASTAGFEVVYHVVTDGRTYSVIDPSGDFRGATLPEDVATAWERTDRTQLYKIDGPEAFEGYVDSLRQGDPSTVHSIIMTARGEVVAVHRHNGKPFDPMLRAEIFRQASTEGAYQIAVDFGLSQLANYNAWNGLMAKYLKDAADYGITFTDASWAGVPSARVTGYLGDLNVSGSADDLPRLEEPAAGEKGQVLFSTSPEAGPTTAGQTAAAPAETAPPKIGTPAGPVTLGGMEHVPPAAFPEIWQILANLDIPVRLRKLSHGIRGLFHPGPTGVRLGRITLDRRLFKRPDQAARTLAHEAGHAADWFPNWTLKRGNLVGHIYALTGHLKHRFGKSTVTDPKLRDELKALSAWWRPWDRDSAPPHFIKYRDSAKELYADAISVLFNAPEELERRAPGFYREFAAAMDRRPQVKVEFYRTWQLLNNGRDAVNAVRARTIREGYESGEQMLRELIEEQAAARNSLHGWTKSLRQQFVSAGSMIERHEAKAEKAGIATPAAENPLYAWEQTWMADNRNFVDLQDIWHKTVQPVEGAGMDLHVLGQVLQLQRTIGNLDAYRTVQQMRDTLPEADMATLERLAEDWKDAQRRFRADPERLDRKRKRLEESLQKAGLDVALFDSYVAAARAQGTRAELGNPMGTNPNTAEDTLRSLLGQYGIDQQMVLLDAADNFREVFFNRASEAHDAGIISDETWKNVILPNRRHYTAWRGLNHVSLRMPAGIIRSKGTVGLIENPFYTTLLKLNALNNAILLNKGKQTVVDWYARPELKAMFPDTVLPAEMVWRNGRMEPRRPREKYERMTVWRDGKPVFYDADPYLVSAFRDMRPGELNAFLKPIDVLFRTGVYPVIITYNPAFQWWSNPQRDIRRTVRNLKALGASPTAFLKNYKAVWGETRRYLRGDLSPLAREAMDAFALGVPMHGVSTDIGRETDVFTDLLARYRLAGMGENRLKELLLAIPRKAVRNVGLAHEARTKLAAWKTLREMGQARETASYNTRTYAGTPNYKTRGTKSRSLGAIMPFSNIFTQGLRTDARLARRPQTRGGWWFMSMLMDVAPAVMKGLGAAGLLGVAVKEWLDRWSDYDLSQYTVIPLGDTIAGVFGVKSVGIRLPHDETGRLVSVLSYKLARRLGEMELPKLKDVQDIAQVGAGALPGVNPVLGIAAAWGIYATDHNPIDTHSGRGVVGRREWMARGLDQGPALRNMVTWTLDRTGWLRVFGYRRDQDQTVEWYERIPGLSGIVKATDAGLREKQQDAEMQEDAPAALRRLNYDGNTLRLLHTYYQLQRLGQDDLTEVQKDQYGLLSQWHSQAYRPIDEYLNSADLHGRGGSPNVRARKRKLATVSEKVVGLLTDLQKGRR